MVAVEKDFGDDRALDLSLALVLRGMACVGRLEGWRTTSPATAAQTEASMTEGAAVDKEFVGHVAVQTDFGRVLARLRDRLCQNLVETMGSC